MRYKVKSAQVHQTIDLAGFTSKRTISNTDMPSAQFFFDELGLHVHFKGRVVIVPSANVAAVNVEEEVE